MPRAMPPPICTKMNKSLSRDVQSASRKRLDVEDAGRKRVCIRTDRSINAGMGAQDGDASADTAVVSDGHSFIQQIVGDS